LGWGGGGGWDGALYIEPSVSAQLALR